MKINTCSLYIFLKPGDIKAVNNQVETRRARAIYLISILPSVYSKSWSQDESQEEPVFLLSVAPPQRAADSLTYWSFTNTGKTTLLLWYIWSIISIMKSLVANRNWLWIRRGEMGIWCGMKHKYSESQRRMWLGLGKGKELGVESVFSPQHCCPTKALSSSLCPRTQLKESPAAWAWMACPPLAMVLQGANELCILTASGGEEERVLSGIHLLWNEGWEGCAASTVFLRNCVMGGRLSRQTRISGGTKQMANKDAISVASVWKDVGLKSLFSFSRSKTHCKMNRLLTRVCYTDSRWEQFLDNLQAWLSSDKEEATPPLSTWGVWSGSWTVGPLGLAPPTGGCTSSYLQGSSGNGTLVSVPTFPYWLCPCGWEPDVYVLVIHVVLSSSISLPFWGSAALHFFISRGGSPSLPAWQPLWDPESLNSVLKLSSPPQGMGKEVNLKLNYKCLQIWVFRVEPPVETRLDGYCLLSKRWKYQLSPSLPPQL